jgi:hypothetical protein
LRDITQPLLYFLLTFLFSPALDAHCSGARLEKAKNGAGIDKAGHENGLVALLPFPETQENLLAIVVIGVLPAQPVKH